MRVDEIVPSLKVDALVSNDILSKINVGDILQARIVEVNSNELLLRLLHTIPRQKGINQKLGVAQGLQTFSDGVLLKASTLSQIYAKKGDIANFLVKMKHSNQIVLETIKKDINTKDTNISETNQITGSIYGEELSELTELSRDSNLETAADNPASIIKTLVKNKLDTNDTNIKVAKELLQHGLTVNGKTINSILEFVSNINGLTIDKAVFLAANKVEPTFKNLYLLNRFIDEQIKIGTELKSFENLLIRLENKEALTYIAKDLNININEAEPSMDTLNNTFKNVFNTIFKDIASATFKEDINPVRAYADILGKLDIIERNIVSITTPNRDFLLTRIDNIKNDIQFMFDLSQNNIYMQLPIRLSDRNSTAELYVMKKHNRIGRIDPSNTIILISLELSNLGHIDSIINIDNKNIMINFRVVNENIIKLMKESLVSLYTGLSEKGYIIKDIKYRLIDDDINLLNATTLVMNEFGAKHTIDYRI